MDTNTCVASGAGKAESEVLTPPGVADGALGFIDLEFESPGNETTDTFFHSACGPIRDGLALRFAQSKMGHATDLPG